jgi:predicted RNA-binding Zn-ribbon protein involved in translation (DUF1610 family)
MLSPNGIVQERNILTSAWKWRGEKKTHSIAISPKSPQDDKHIVEKMISLFNEADAVVAHYGDGFDHRYIMGRAIFHGLHPPKPVIQIDTWKIAKSKFLFNSNRLDYLGHYLGLGRKIKTDQSLWDGCMEGKTKAIRDMATYNRQDVDLLAAVFEKLAPYVPAKVNAALFSEKPVCPNCGEPKLQKRGHAISRTSVHQRYQCLSCGGWSSAPKEGGVVR